MDIITYLIRTTILITAGIVIANIALESNILGRLSSLIKPLSRILNISQMSVLSIMTAFLSPTAGKSTLSGFYREGKIGDKETIATVVMSTFPIVFTESFLRAHAPITLVLLGPKIGGIYIFLKFLSSFLQSFAAFIYTRFFLPQIESQEELDDNELEKIPKTPPNIKTAFKNSFKTLKRVIPIMVITFLAIALLMELGILDYIGLLSKPVFEHLGLPGEAVTALIAQFVHYSASYATISMLLAEGIVTAKQALITLLIGSIISITMIYIRYSFSMYVSLFGGFGVKVAAINYSCSIIAKVLMIILVMIFM